VIIGWGIGVRWLMRGLATLSQGSQEPLVITDTVGRPQMSLGWASSWHVILFTSLLWHYWLGCLEEMYWFIDGVDLTGALHVL